METSIETYFWLVDRLNLQDDPKNKVNMGKNTVACSKQLQTSIANGFYVARLLNEMHLTYQSRSEKNFQLGAGLREIMETDKPFLAKNWQALWPELEKFGLVVDDKKRQSMIKNVRSDLAVEILD